MPGNYTQVFGGNTLWPSDVSYLRLDLTEDVTLQWPLEASTGNYIVARIMDVFPDGPGRRIFMPPAIQTGVGQVVQFFNGSPDSYDVVDSTGGAILTVADGETWELYLTDSSTVAGQWRSYQQGSVTSTAQAAALAGYGLVAIGPTLAQAQDVTTFNSDYTTGAADRAKAFVWTGGLGTLTLEPASDMTNGWFISVRNEGNGDLEVLCSGGDLINGAPFLTLQPDDSCFINTDGTTFYTVGMGQDPVFAFDYTAIDLTGAGSTYTLTGAELNRISYRFFGTLSNNVDVIVPSTTQQYWVANDTTGGSFTMSIGTTGQIGPPIVPRGSRGIYYCQGVSVVKADTASIALPISISDGGTGATSAAGARINLGGTSVGIGVFTAANATDARLSLNAAGAGINSDITQLTGLTTPLSVSQGGTGQTTSIFVSDNAWTGKNTFSGTTSKLAIKLANALEPVTVSATAASGTIDFDLTTQSIVYYTTNASANWTINFRGNGTNSLDSLMAVGESVTATFMATQGATAYFNNVVQVDGTTSGVTTRWLGSVPIAGNTSSVDIYTYVAVKTGAATFTVFASTTGTKT